MSSNRTAAIALVAGSVAGLVTMALHPTGRDVVHGAATVGSNALVAAVHVLALLGQGAVLAGALGVVNALRRRRDLAVAGYVFFALAAVAVIIAAAASGFLAPSVLHGYAEADEAGRQRMIELMHYTGLVNQTFAKLNVLFVAVALMLWSAATYAGRELTRGLGVYGLILSVALLAGIGSGVLRLDIHGFGLVVLGEGIWLVWAARQLWAAET